MQLMKKELEREEPRKEIIISLMKLTYSVRREYILSDSSELSATAVLEEYRALTKVPVVSELCNVRIIIRITVPLFKKLQQEIDIISGRRDIVKAALEEWKSKWVQAITTYTESLKSKVMSSALQAAKNAYAGMYTWNNL